MNNSCICTDPQDYMERGCTVFFFFLLNIFIIKTLKCLNLQSQSVLPGLKGAFDQPLIFFTQGALSLLQLFRVNFTRVLDQSIL